MSSPSANRASQRSSAYRELCACPETALLQHVKGHFTGRESITGTQLIRSQLLRGLIASVAVASGGMRPEELPPAGTSGRLRDHSYFPIRRPILFSRWFRSACWRRVKYPPLRRAMRLSVMRVRQSALRSRAAFAGVISPSRSCLLIRWC